jgi:hypothetical protein
MHSSVIPIKISIYDILNSVSIDSLSSKRLIYQQHIAVQIQTPVFLLIQMKGGATGDTGNLKWGKLRQGQCQVGQVETRDSKSFKNIRNSSGSYTR